MKSQAILTVVGRDRPGIVSAVSQSLFDAGCSIEDAGMMRVGGYFSIMQVLRYPADLGAVETALVMAVEKLGLRIHLDPIPSLEADDVACNCTITVTGADHPGIMAGVSGALTNIGCNIIGLDGHIEAGDKPLYVMRIRVDAPHGIDAVEKALGRVKDQEQVHISVHPTGM